MYNNYNGNFLFDRIMPDENNEVIFKERLPPPNEVLCLLCKELLKDAVITPCCTKAYCDECKIYYFIKLLSKLSTRLQFINNIYSFLTGITNYLLDSPNNKCQGCDAEDILPDSLMPNKSLRLKCIEFCSQK